MFSPNLYIERRKKLLDAIPNGIIIIFGNNKLPMNYIGNSYPFRQDSNFLYFCGIDRPGLALVLQKDPEKIILYGNEDSEEDILWDGKRLPLSDTAERVGIEKVKSRNSLRELIHAAGLVDENIHYLPPYRCDRRNEIQDLLGIPEKQQHEKASTDLIKAVIQLRSIKSPEEIEEIENNITHVTAPMFINTAAKVMSMTSENEVAASIYNEVLLSGQNMAFTPICTVRGEVLHNETYNNSLYKNSLLLIDAGAESPLHYASDITRTLPVSGKFNQQQKDIYNIVLEANLTSITHCKPGIAYIDIHKSACLSIISGLIDLNIMEGDKEEIYESGAHALFMPHGIGHMMGLDVHDMQDLGEDLVGYSDNYTRSTQFGTSFLRMARKLEKGMVLTVEPGVYFIPALINKWESENILAEYINYDALDDYRTFGGIRIEDDIVITEEGSRLLGKPIPKSIADIEGIMK